MKIIKQKVEVEIEKYVCEVCGIEYKCDFQAKNCEARHVVRKKQQLCKHNFEYTFESDTDDYYIDLKIIKKCDNCGIYFKKDIEDSDFTSDELKIIFDRLQ